MVRYYKWYKNRYSSKKNAYRKKYRQDYNLIHYKPNWKVVVNGRGLGSYTKVPKKAQGKKGYPFWSKEPLDRNYYAYKYRNKKKKDNRRYKKSGWDAW